MRFILLALCLFEALLITYWSDIAGPYINPVLLLLTSGCIGFCYLRIVNKVKSSDEKTINGKKTRKPLITAMQVAGFAGLSLIMCYKVWRINHIYSISAGDTSHSDIIPLIMHSVRRFLSGEFVYTTIHFSGYDLVPNYMPFTWMPFCLVEWLHIDYRWLPPAFFWCCAAWFFISSLRKNAYRTLPEQLLVPVWPLIVWCIVVFNDSTIIAYPVESLIAGYYLLLALSLNGKNMVFAGIMLSVCLLSRYAVVLWVPVCVAALLLAGKRKQLFLMLSVCLVFFLAFYGLPFLRKDPSIFMKGYNYYTTCAIGEWNAGTTGGFWHLGNGLGFTKYIFRFFPHLDIPEKVALYKNIQLAVLGAGIVSLLAYYLRNRARISVGSFLLFSLKIYLALFYAFIQVPYRYLFLVPVIVSAALLTGIYRKTKSENNVSQMP